jgi:hypothetical protein
MKTSMASMQSEQSRTKAGFSNIPWKDISKEHRARPGNQGLLYITQRTASSFWSWKPPLWELEISITFVLTFNPALFWSDISRILQVLGV